MNGTMSTGDARSVGTGGFTPPQLLAGCLVVSLVLHAGLFWLLPEWRREPVIVPVPVLDVEMVALEPETETTPPRRASPETPQFAAPQRVPREPQPAPRQAVSSQMTDVPAAPVRPRPVAVDAVPGELPRPPMAAREIPAPPAESLTMPMFNAAYLRNPPPRYPPVARRNGDQGTVMLKVLVNPEGAPVRVELDQSSGSSSLDRAALDAVRAWRFVPARRGTQNIEAWVRVPVVFRLES